mmetsp:Transcript_20215/g.42810  ORF Transcript_20215/g.42810 Transcript_20215/m.42810 type:complete len:201 (+) Transcript_20215:310-912(+)
MNLTECIFARIVARMCSGNEPSRAQVILSRFIVYRLLAGPPRVRPLAAAADCPGFFALVLVSFASLDFPGRGNLVPSLRSSLLIICGFGMAFPDSYSATTWGFSLIAVASCFWVIFLAVRACMSALLRDLSTLAMVPTSVASSSFLADMIPVLCADAFPPDPYRFSIPTDFFRGWARRTSHVGGAPVLGECLVSSRWHDC